MKAFLGVVMAVAEFHYIANKGLLVLENKIRGFSHIKQQLCLSIKKKKEVTNHCVFLYNIYTVTHY